MCQNPPRRPEVRAFFTNLAGPEPWLTKLKLLFRNNWLKLKNRQNCCGHLGKPGC